MGHIAHNHGGVLPAAVVNYIGALRFSYVHVYICVLSEVSRYVCALFVLLASSSSS